VSMTELESADYETALAYGRGLYPGVRIGRPGRARTYWATIAAMRILRLRWSVHVTGDENVAPGAAILVGNHVSAMDPVAAVMSHWWRVTAFTKVEVFERRGAVFFRLMGQIPLRRGDEESSVWALDMARRTLADGGKLGLYPEGTRSPDKRSLHRLHKRILLPVIQASPDVPVHAIATTYSGARHGRRRVDIALSERLPIDVTSMDGDAIVDTIRDALLTIGGMPYVDAYARNVKAAAARPQKD
jgi:1-acyl-sn-glycerol-3-phosphate acyltransferase